MCEQMVHSAAWRLIERRTEAPENPPISLYRLQNAVGDSATTKRPRGGGIYPGRLHFEGTFGGRGNYLPADQPVVFKRSFVLKLVRDIPAEGDQPAASEILTKACSAAAVLQPLI